jgi:cytochrome c-type biogenesis protein CcmF
MIAEIGLAALWLAAALAVLQMVSGGFALRSVDGAPNPLAIYARPAAIVQAVLAVLAFLLLLRAFAITDLSIKLVATNSHSMKPLIYKLTGTWGNHEGSMLLWVGVLALSGGLLAAFEKRLPGFYAFLLLSSNPFERLPVPAVEGTGLNPLLQDIGLAIHPPTLYAGYVGLSVAFSLAMGALLTKEVNPSFARVMRPWVLGAWVLLTFGITAGSYWAYYELGWGGWWFWDPVENASLMPWLAATALMHSVSVLAARDALRTWTIMLGVLAFSMSMLGTFLVRSGVLTSVHAFAVDPERGAFILGLLGLYIGGAFTIFALRAGAVAEGKLYPLLTEAFDVRVSVGPPYFNPAAAIFAVPMFLVMAVGPLLRWKEDKPARIQFEMMLVAAVLIGMIALVSFFGQFAFLPLLGLGLAAALAVAAVLPLKGRKLTRVPVATWGMVLAHFGVAVSLFGMACEGAFTQERLAAVAPGGTEQVGDFAVTLQSVTPVAGPNWTAIEARLAVSQNGGEPVILAPQARNFWSPAQATSESALLTRWNGQLYAVIGNQAEDGRWQIRVWWKPFVTFIWYGGLLIALGGVLAIAGRVKVDLKRRKATAMGDARRADLEALGAAAPVPAE